MVIYLLDFLNCSFMEIGNVEHHCYQNHLMWKKWQQLQEQEKCLASGVSTNSITALDVSFNVLGLRIKCGYCVGYIEWENTIYIV